VPMRSAVISSTGASFGGRRASCCGQPTRPGQAILWHRLEPKAYASTMFIVHVECMAAACEVAPEGIPVKRGVLEVRRIRQRAKRLTEACLGD